MNRFFWHLVLVCFSPWIAAQPTGNAAALSEQDFLAEMPIVLSVSRLAQRLDEVPGAVTVLDRGFIRMSGARDVADLLRLVPGFQTTTAFETDAPMASYHGRSDDWSNRLQVLVDGRAVYSGYLQGSTGVGLQTLAIDDIERIEVLRGSNSATYGARAFLGVVNIVSRDVRETTGAAASISMGDNRIGDSGVRLGWGDATSAYRVSVDRRADAGLRGAFGANEVSRVNLAVQLTPDFANNITVRGGGLDIAAGRGNINDHEGNIARMRTMGSRFVQLDWTRILNPDHDIAFSASHTEIQSRDAFSFQSNAYGPLYVGTLVDFGGNETNDTLSFQSTNRHSEQLRTVWGVQFLREVIVSRPTFDARQQVTSDFYRLFGNAEWRLRPNLILNAGAMAENSSIGGESISPRLMLNWHLNSEQTLRAGVSTAFRPPSAYEKYANVNYYNVLGQNPINTVRVQGNVNSEKVISNEVGYHLNKPAWGLSGDLRIFNEQIKDGIANVDGALPTDIANVNNFSIYGAEYELRWLPAARTQLILTQTFLSVGGVPDPTVGQGFRLAHGVPDLSGSLTLMHTTPSGLELSVLYGHSDHMALMSSNLTLSSVQRMDVRIARGFRLGKNKADVALTVQNLNAPYQDGDRQFYFDQRALLTLRIEQ
jgi:iron complex outermembrane recepter protein